MICFLWWDLGLLDLLAIFHHALRLTALNVVREKRACFGARGRLMLNANADDVGSVGTKECITEQQFQDQTTAIVGNYVGYHDHEIFFLTKSSPL